MKIKLELNIFRSFFVCTDEISSITMPFIFKGFIIFVISFIHKNYTVIKKFILCIYAILQGGQTYNIFVQIMTKTRKRVHSSLIIGIYKRKWGFYLPQIAPSTYNKLLIVRYFHALGWKFSKDTICCFAY